ncbi:MULTISPECIES: TetR/AcrR family transcriptional regulator [unclassified Variovorax]|uniref:TetR/AcrR family transcriptional regulator n=1 Tax=unclassified Variovorax TaxID=663243 RepID=UPI0013161AD4|nr:MULTISPECIES: TetR/AcrR family transcriptional regulator [unclassified Variovorax]VTU14889.1 HTH-type transcriptional repressor KstR2 [Variovorax sp. SRS16]VTU22299.1 HTH-type transcriptional repressor KstR2 [Variovorax sp. PBL-E5]
MSDVVSVPDRKSFSKKAPDVRRQELIDATFRCLCDRGVFETSVRTIASEAGLSLGMVRHHFNSKDELLAATYRNMSERLKEQTQELLARTPPDSMSQLVAFINAGLQPPLLDRNYVRIRFLFFELTHTNKVVKRVHEEIYARFEQQLLALVTAVARDHGSKADCRMVTRTITTYLKGIWAEWTLSSDDFEPRELLAQMMSFWLGMLAPDVVPAQMPIDRPAGVDKRVTAGSKRKPAAKKAAAPSRRTRTASPA